MLHFNLLRHASDEAEGATVGEVQLWVDVKRCNRCGKYKTLDNFGSNGSGKLKAACLPCEKERRQHLNSHPEERGQRYADRSRDTDTYKTCGSCRQLKPRVDFYPRPSNRDGLDYACAACQRNRGTDYRKDHPFYVKMSNERKRLQRLEDPLKEAIYQRNKRYKIDFEAKLASQGGNCGACGAALDPVGNYKDTSAHVDHDHSCCPGANPCGNCNRDILCSICNRIIGLAREDIGRLKLAIAYLEKWKQGPVG